MDYQMLKELKRKMDADNEKRSQASALHDLLPKNLNAKATPKTFSPDHKPINPRISQNSEFTKNNANSISSKLNYVNFESFFEFKDKATKAKVKIPESPNQHKVKSFHKKNPSETGSIYGLPLKKQMMNTNDSANYSETVASQTKIAKKPEASSFPKNDLLSHTEINSHSNIKGEENEKESKSSSAEKKLDETSKSNKK